MKASDVIQDVRDWLEAYGLDMGEDFLISWEQLDIALGHARDELEKKLAEKEESDE